MARILPAATPTPMRTMPTMARGQLATTTATEIRKEATNKIVTAVQAALLWPCPCSAMGPSPRYGACASGQAAERDAALETWKSLCQRRPMRASPSVTVVEPALDHSAPVSGVLTPGQLVPCRVVSGPLFACRVPPGHLACCGRVIPAGEPKPVPPTNQRAEPSGPHDERRAEREPRPAPRSPVGGNGPAAAGAGSRKPAQRSAGVGEDPDDQGCAHDCRQQRGTGGDDAHHRAGRGHGHSRDQTHQRGSKRARCDIRPPGMQNTRAEVGIGARARDPLARTTEEDGHRTHQHQKQHHPLAGQYDDHGVRSPEAEATARKAAAALLTLSSSSSWGTESATIPPPAWT